MPITYEKPDDFVIEEVERLEQAHFPDLLEAFVTIGALVKVSRGRDGELTEGPCLKLHGSPAAAVVKINSLKDRAEKKPDATITIDGNTWEEHADSTKTAILHHELHHLIVCRKGDQKSPIMLDAVGRPKLVMRPHDFEVGWFHDIAGIYGDASLEVQQAKAFADEHGQLYFGWEEPPKRAVESAGSAFGPEKTKKK